MATSTQQTRQMYICIMLPAALSLTYLLQVQAKTWLADNVMKSFQENYMVPTFFAFHFLARNASPQLFLDGSGVVMCGGAVCSLLNLRATAVSKTVVHFYHSSGK